jgi:uncharacterized protein (UPF0248 family)
MGVWGVGPFDHDGAADIAVKMSCLVDEAINKGSDYYYDGRTAAHVMLLMHGTDILGGPLLHKPLDLLVRMRSDQEWLSSWKFPKKIAEALNADIVLFLDKMKHCKGCRRWLDDVAAVDAVARAQGLPVPRHSTSRARRVRTTRGKVVWRRKK